MKKKIYWQLNWLLCGLVTLILLVVFLFRYFKVGSPLEETWFLEALKYVVMDAALTVICWVIAWAPFKMLSAYIAKKKGEPEE